MKKLKNYNNNLKKSGKKIFFFCFFILSFFIFNNSFALDIPKLNNYVNDFTNTLSQNEKYNLEKELSNFEKQTSNQIVFLMINSLENEFSIEDYSLKVAELNKIGTKEKDNGVLFTVIKNDRELRIEVGYGLEGFLTDAKSSYIIRNIITPEFKNENYYEGIKNGLQEIIKTSSDANYLNNEINKNKKYETYSVVFGLIFFIIFIILFIKYPSFREFVLWMIIFSKHNGGGSSGKSSGGFGGFGGFSGGGGGFGGGGSSGKW